MPSKKEFVPLTREGIVMASAAQVPVGALVKGVSGSIGKYSLSFFNPVLASTAGNFVTFLGMGALTTLIKFIPALVSKHLVDNNDYLNKHPFLKNILNDTIGFSLTLAATVASAAIIGFPPFGATVLCMMIIPTAIYALSMLCNVINLSLAASSSFKEDISSDISMAL